MDDRQGQGPFEGRAWEHRRVFASAVGLPVDLEDDVLQALLVERIEHL